jgi:hypothetical protein
VQKNALAPKFAGGRSGGRLIAKYLFCNLLLFLAPMLSWAQMFPSDCSNGVPAIHPVPFELEGVYEVKVESEKIVELRMTLLKNLDSERLSLTFATAFSNQTIFFLSCVVIEKIIGSTYKIEAKGLNYSGARTAISLAIDINTMTVKGELSGNFLRNEKPLLMTGKRLESIYEILRASRGVPCGPQDNFYGTYKGFFGDNKPAQLNVFRYEKSNGTEGISGNIISSINILFHDGQFDKSNSLLSLVNNYGYSFSGQSKKLMFVCEQDSEYYILRGLHISSTGTIVRNALFKKAK